MSFVPPAIGGMSFGSALEALKAGEKVTRRNWNGRNMYIEIQTPDGAGKMTLPYIFMYTAGRELVPWLASQTDMLAEDWELL